MWAACTLLLWWGNYFRRAGRWLLAPDLVVSEVFLEWLLQAYWWVMWNPRNADCDTCLCTNATGLQVYGVDSPLY